MTNWVTAIKFELKASHRQHSSLFSMWALRIEKEGILSKLKGPWGNDKGEMDIGHILLKHFH